MARSVQTREVLANSQSSALHQISEAPICGLDWIRRSEPPNYFEEPCDVLRLADLFCGCGGLSLGAREAARQNSRRLEIEFAIDIAAPALEAYRSNFGVDDTCATEADINVVLPNKLGSPPAESETEIYRKISQVDLVLAGPPCQGHSDLNNSSRRNDSRNELYLKVARFAEIVRPSAVIIENVPAVIHDETKSLKLAKDWFVKQGYHITESVVPFLNLGLPQNRKRHILVCTRKEFILPTSLDEAQKADPPSIRDFILDIQDEWRAASDIFRTPSRMSAANQKRARYLIEENLFDLPNKLRPKCHQDGNHSYKSMYGRLDWDKPAQTITTGFGSMGQGRYLHPADPRVLTPHEAARLQGFPDFFSFSAVNQRTHLHEMIGNAVPPQLTAHLVNTFIRQNII